jgi:hypothetical protein
VLIGAFVVAHFWMMRRGHRGHGGNNTEDKIGVSAKQSEKKGEDEKHKHKDCCH